MLLSSSHLGYNCNFWIKYDAVWIIKRRPRRGLLISVNYAEIVVYSRTRFNAFEWRVQLNEGNMWCILRTLYTHLYCKKCWPHSSWHQHATSKKRRAFSVSLIILLVGLVPLLSITDNISVHLVGSLLVLLFRYTFIGFCPINCCKFTIQLD